MSVQHKDIPDAQLHEPKGAASAVNGSAYISNGAGSGVWTIISRYGELYITNGVSTHTLAAASAFSLLNPGTGWSNGVVSGVTQFPASGYIRVDSTGTYHLSFWCSFQTSAAAAGSLYKFSYAVNGVAVSRKIVTSKYSNGIDTLCVSASGVASLTNADQISIQVAGDGSTSGTNITILEAGLVLHKA